MEKYTLKQLREVKGETQEQVSTAIELNRALYSHYENGIRMPRVDIAKKIAKYFNVSVEEIIFLNTNDTKSHKGDNHTA
ncbi:helix-turn-helix transcriptional regulator [Tissierella sp. MB52-C2]|uniref:helix-turn-helix transcriptional regulator n=1 Tax=Tissierella sp. MB52-C2 TaxID=3070999 RepID=UPI00280A5A59|nr:helix-turn-helix transcriptional regulator [Tissierella sp. MB52-C2]WMM24088.1 helix-turn-helix transcriptional regulator [Tissierella sp. MB52-C2]